MLRNHKHPHLVDFIGTAMAMERGADTVRIRISTRKCYYGGCQNIAATGCQYGVTVLVVREESSLRICGRCMACLGFYVAREAPFIDRPGLQRSLSCARGPPRLFNIPIIRQFARIFPMWGGEREAKLKFSRTSATLSFAVMATVFCTRCSCNDP